MNQRNVEAIEDALWNVGGQDGSWEGLTTKDLAQELAARGVLAPSALTDDDYDPALYAACSSHSMEYFGTLLERIAKGESA